MARLHASWPLNSAARTGDRCHALKALLWSFWGRMGPRLEDMCVSQGGRLQHGPAPLERRADQQLLPGSRLQ